MPESRKRKKKQSGADAPVQQATKVKESPTWWAPTMVTLMVLGLVWVVVTYLWHGNLPIPGIGNWNLAIGGGITLAGFLMTMGWK